MKSGIASRVLIIAIGILLTFGCGLAGAVRADDVKPMQGAAAPVPGQKNGLLPEEITLDGQVFKKDQLNQSFLDAVFTKDVLNENGDGLQLAVSDNFSEKSVIHPTNIKTGYPWIYPHLYPQDGLPRLLAANKWIKSPRVSFGMPNELKPFQQTASTDELYITDENYEQADLFRKSHTYSLAIKNVQKLLPELSELTGLKIDYLPQEKETTQDYAEIRINLITRPDRPEYHYKEHLYRVVLTDSWGRSKISFPYSVEDKIKTGFIYTSNSQNQVDGYFLSNFKNEIQMAVCYIWQGHDEQMLKLLINECLIRSMGLPGAMRMNFAQRPVPASYLTLWNDPEIWSESYRSQVKTPSELSEFDQYMIRTLYNPAIKPGMDYMAAQRILLGTEY